MEKTDKEIVFEACELAVAFIIEGIRTNKRAIDINNKTYPGLFILNKKDIATINKNYRANLNRLYKTIGLPKLLLKNGESISFPEKRKIRRNSILAKVIELSMNNIIRIKYLDVEKLEQADCDYINKVTRDALRASQES